MAYIINKIMFPSQPEITNIYHCQEEKIQALEAAERKIEDPIFSEGDIPSEIHFNSDSERREFFRYIQRSLVGQKCLQLIEAAKNGQTDFNASFVFLINAMLNPIAESRPTACDLARLLPVFEALLPFQRPDNYGKKMLLEGYGRWHAVKEEEEKRKGSEWSLHSSAMFGSAGSRKSSSGSSVISCLNETMQPQAPNDAVSMPEAVRSTRLSF